MGVGLRLAVSVESFPIKGGFTISRGSKHEAVVVVATIDDGTHDDQILRKRRRRRPDQGRARLAAARGRGPQCPRLCAVGS